jgi:hypothetical protein
MHAMTNVNQDEGISGIALRQNRVEQLRQLQAVRQLYADAKRLVTLQLVLFVVVPVAAAITGIFVPDPTLKGWIAMAAIVITVLDVALLDRTQRTTITNAAKVQEAFDVAVLDLPWDDFDVGERAPPEIVHNAWKRHDRRHGLRGLRNWYPIELGRMTDGIARLACQRGVLVYDSGVRRPYAITAVLFAGAICFGLVAVALSGGLSVEAFVVTAIIPAAPIVTWAVREFYRNTEAANANDKLKAQVEKVLTAAREGKVKEPALAVFARRIQSEIYRQRKAKPLTFSWVYKLLRARLEAQMRGVAAELAEVVEARQQPVAAKGGARRRRLTDKQIQSGHVASAGMLATETQPDSVGVGSVN